ncbi:MAG TPA: hypothetical protein VG456_16525 [Candidatus Sulfopaludibacter sp.]|jgi:hypothetical protein|nr:hypothetical protein [Candidatus Sulfopaludibacter sp.]
MTSQASAKAKPQAKLELGVRNGVPTVEVVVPYGTTLSQVAEMHSVISQKAIAQLSPRGCAQCTSGVHVTIREELENVILVDLPQAAH